MGGGWLPRAGGPESRLQAGNLTRVFPELTRRAAGRVLAMRPQQAPVSGKVFIQRDYSSGTRCQFQTKFPAELENRVRSLSLPCTCLPWGGRVPGAGGRECGSTLPAAVPWFWRAVDLQIDSKRCTKKVRSRTWRRTAKATAQSTEIL